MRSATAFIVLFSLLLPRLNSSEQKKYRLFHKPDIVSPFDLPRWGSYRPGSYFGMKQKNPPPNFITGIMWTTEELVSRSRIRHMVDNSMTECFEPSLKSPNIYR